MKKLILKRALIICVFLFPALLFGQPLIGTKTIGGLNPDYPTLTAAFSAATTNGVSGSVIFILQSGYSCSSEVFPLYPPTNLTAVNQITVIPGVSGLFIESSNDGPTIQLNGSQYFTIDGRVNGQGSTKDLVISNTSTVGTTIQFINDACYNTLKYCVVKGVTTAAANGVINFLVAVNIGNSYNTIDNSDIRDGVSTPSNCIYSNGTASKENRGNVLTNCNIFNFYNTTGSGDQCGVLLAANNADWTITGCSFYQTATRTPAATTNFYPVSSSSGTTTTLNITSNYIGGSAPACGGTPMTLNGTSSLRCMRLTTSSNGVSSIQGNVIQNISMNTSTTSSALSGICLVTGSYNCGNLIPNTIGSLTVPGSIAINATSGGTTVSFSGINAGTGTPGTILISNNNIAGISMTGLNAALRGIWVSGFTPSYTITENTIGTLAAPLTNACNRDVTGIYSQAKAVNVIANNNIRYLSTTGISNGNQVIGIWESGGNGGSYMTNGNFISNLSSTSTSTGSGSGASVIGILHTANTDYNQIISNNTIHSLSNSATAVVTLTGIYYNGPTGGSNTVNNNFIHSFSNSGALAGGAQIGIQTVAGNLRFYNNMIRLGIDELGNSVIQPCKVIGIYKTGGSISAFFNNVYIGGSGVTETPKSYACWRYSTGQDSIMNNIFMNARSSLTQGLGAKNFGYVTNNVTQLISDYNIFYTTGNDGAIASTDNGVTNLTSLSQIHNAFQGQEVHSWVGNPNYINPTAGESNLNLHIQSPSVIESAGKAIPNITTDYDGEIRSGLSPTDIGADALMGNNPELCMGTPNASAIIGDDSICNGSSVTLSLNYTYSNQGLTFSWYSGLISGGPYENFLGYGSSITINNLTATIAVICVITCNNTNQSFTTNEKIIHVNNAPVISIIQQPSNQIVYTGNNANFNVLVSGGVFNYQWQRSINNAVSFSNLSIDSVYIGTNTNLLTVKNCQMSMNNNIFRCIISGCQSPTISSFANLTVQRLIRTKVDTFIRCIGDTIVVPIKVWYFDSIGSVSLRLKYKTSALQFLAFQNVQPNIGFTSYFTTGGSVQFASFNTNPVLLPDGSTLFEAKFKYLSDSSYLQWETWSAGSCQYSDLNNAIVPATFVSGVVYSVSPSVSISQNPPGAFCPGTSITFTADQTNGGVTPVYQWKKNGVNVGSNAPTYNSTTLVNGDVITCSLTSNAVCSSATTVVSNSLTMVVLPSLAVSVTVVPAPSSTVCAGTIVTYTATPSNGGTAPTYQWKKNNLLIVGATNPTYTYVPVNGDAITCVVTSNATCATGNPVTSNFVAMTVNPLPLAQTTAPLSVCPGSSVQLGAVAIPGHTYLWSSSPPGFTSMVSNPLVNPTSTTQYFLTETITSTGCQKTNSVIITVIPAIPVSVTIAANPSGAICQGTSVTYTATPTNGGTSPTYQWKKNGVNVGTGISFTSSTLANGDVINCVLTSNEGCISGNPATSNSITQVVNPNLPVSVSISANPSNTVCAGSSVSFTATPTNGGTSPVYQWKRNGINVGTSPTYTYTPTNGDIINCILTSNANCATGSPYTSASITMTVNPNLPVSLSIAAIPSGPICSGTTVNFTATPTNGGTSPSYVWKKNGISVGTSPTYSSATLVNGDQITCTLTSNASCGYGSPYTTSPIMMQVNPLPSASGAISGPTSLCQGQSGITYSIASIPNATSYNWSLPGGFTGTSTTNSILVSAGANAQSGTITVYGQNSCGNGASSSLNVSISNALSVNAGLDDTIALGTSINLTANVTQGTGPFTFMWSNGLTGPTVTLSPTVTTSYSVTVTDANGCSANDVVVISVYSANTIFNTLPVVSNCTGANNYPVIVSNLNQVASISLSILYNPQQLTYTGYQSLNPQLAQGTIMVNATNNKIQIGWFAMSPINIINTDTLLKLNFNAVNGNSPLSWDLTTPGACYYTDGNGASIPAVYTNGSFTGFACSTIQGNITYANNASSPLSNCPVHLINGGNILIQNTTGSGNYSFSNLVNGTYYLQPTCNKPWGGVNANDALLILKHFVNIVPLTGWKLKAADVDGTHFVNSADALIVSKRFVGLISSFVVGDWLLEQDTISIIGPSTITSNLKGICFGDVDGSYNPPAKHQPSINLVEEGVLLANRNQDISLPFYISQQVKVGSVSMVLKIDPEVMLVKDVKVAQEGNLLFHLKGNELRMGWYSLVPMDLNTNDPLFTISASINQPDQIENAWLTMSPESQLGDENGVIYTDLTLKYPRLLLSNGGLVLGQNIPNPFKGRTEIPYYLPEPGFVDLKVFDVFGREVLSAVNSKLDKGNHSITIDFGKLPAGVYFYRMTVQGESNHFTGTRRMVLEK